MVLEEAWLDTQALRLRFGTDLFTVEEAEQFTLVDTAYLPSHLRKRTFKPAEQAGDLEAVDPPPNRQRWTNPDASMRLRFTR